MWNVLWESVVGTSHGRSGLPCQDSSYVHHATRSHDELLILVCADGAGSAEHGGDGATLACRELAMAIARDLGDGHFVSRIDRERMLTWYTECRQSIEGLATRRETPIRQFACTLLVAVIDSEAAAFAQIGDGGIVIRQGESYDTIFWPQTGEYANTTFFITDENFSDSLQFAIKGVVNECALFTDGIQRVALNIAAREVHSGFFTPLFEELGRAEQVDSLRVPFRAFLDSPALNERTDDDKTLVLATRRGIAAWRPDTSI